MMKKVGKGGKKVKKQHLVYCLDCSGSMLDRQDQAISGTNEYLAQIRDNAPGTRLTLVTFNTEVKDLVTGKDISKVEPITGADYQPDGMTALLDAVGHAVSVAEEKVKDGEPVIVAIFTDGLENASTTYTKEKLKSRIQELEARGNWTFTYLGVGQEAWSEAMDIGVSKGNTTVFDPNVKLSYANAGRMASTFINCSQNSAVAANTRNFFDADHLNDVSSKTEEELIKTWNKNAKP